MRMNFLVWSGWAENHQWNDDLWMPPLVSLSLKPDKDLVWGRGGKGGGFFTLRPKISLKWKNLSTTPGTILPVRAKVEFLNYSQICKTVSATGLNPTRIYHSEVWISTDWAKRSTRRWLKFLVGEGVLDQYLGIGKPRRVWNPDPDKKSYDTYPVKDNTLNLITLFRTKDKMHVVLF